LECVYVNPAVGQQLVGTVEVEVVVLHQQLLDVSEAVCQRRLRIQVHNEEASARRDHLGCVYHGRPSMPLHSEPVCGGVSDKRLQIHQGAVDATPQRLPQQFLQAADRQGVDVYTVNTDAFTIRQSQLETGRDLLSWEEGIGNWRLNKTDDIKFPIDEA
ncbi:MAG: hypothetical protein ACKPKO_23265, partial [Candidatus Fonsibacter sp.]